MDETRPPPYEVMLRLNINQFTMCKFAQRCFKGESCTWPHSEEEWEVWNCALDEFRGMYFEVRPPPTTEQMDRLKIHRFRMCKFRHRCYDGIYCTYPHNVEEKKLWNVALISYRGTQVRVPPSMEKMSQLRIRLFIMCKFGESCTRGIRCTYPHNEDELKLWNNALLNYRDSPRSLSRKPTKTHKAGARGGTLQSVSAQHQHLKDAALLLTRENYKKKFTALLYLEEEVHSKLLKEKCNGPFKFRERKYVPRNLQRHDVEHTHFAIIEGMSGDQMMYVAQASECVYILRNGQRAKADILPGGDLSKVDGKLFIAFDQWEASKCFRKGVGYSDVVMVEFEVKHSFFDDLRRSLNNLSGDAIARIMPTAEHFSTGLDLNRVPFPQLSSMELDKECQFPALQLVLFSRSLAPVIIPGPFGTGKTRILAVAAYSFVELAIKSKNVCRVLVCCHHQVSADTFIENYFGAMSVEKHTSRKIGLVRLTRRNYYHRGLAYEHMYVPIHEFKRQFKAGHYADAKQLVIVTTFLTALNAADLFGANFFTHILLDEGAQAREPEAVAPLCMANNSTKIVIAGDCQQVGPALLVLGDDPQKFGLGISLLERLLQAYKDAGETSSAYIAQICNNYRSHKDILELPSQLFYSSSLKPMSKAITHPDAPYPLIFVCSSVADPVPVADDINIKEAEILIGQFHRFCKSEDIQSFSSKTCFMALSRRQVAHLKSCLKKGKKILPVQQVFPSYLIQGREFKAVFISTVECVHDGFQSANPTKSFCNRYVFNTALTRAQSLVVVAGNPFLLLKVEAAMPKPMGCWRAYLRRCIDHNTFIVPKEICNDDVSVVEKLRQLVEPTKGGPASCITPRIVPPPCD